MSDYSIMECASCGNIKIISNELELSSKEASCDCGKEDITLYGLMKDKKFEFKKTQL